MSSALGGYFTAVEKIPQYSAVQMLEQCFRIAVVVLFVSKLHNLSASYACIIIVSAMTAAEVFSFTLSSILKKRTVMQVRFLVYRWSNHTITGCK